MLIILIEIVLTTAVAALILSIAQRRTAHATPAVDGDERLRVFREARRRTRRAR